jgi:NAD-dependent dihydropyrimidine dehydrogenase PreA subunit
MKPNRRLVLLIEKFFPQRFKIARFTNYPFFKWLAHKMIFKDNNLTILPKDNVVEIVLNKKISPIENVVVPSKVIEYFINETNHIFIMNFCLCREAMNCSNHPIELGCIFMGDSAMKINPEFGRLVSKKEAIDHIKKCRDADLVHIIGRDKLDETWLGVKDGFKLLTVCNCCSCCCLWKMIKSLDKNLATAVKKMPGLKVVATDDCNGCGKCIENICFLDGIKIIEGKAVIPEDCRACGRCVEICQNNAIKLIIEDDKFIEKTIERINKSVVVK